MEKNELLLLGCHLQVGAMNDRRELVRVWGSMAGSVFNFGQGQASAQKGVTTDDDRRTRLHLRLTEQQHQHA